MDYLWIVILVGYAVCVVQAIYSLTTNRPVMPRLSLLLLSLAFAAHTVQIISTINEIIPQLPGGCFLGFSGLRNHGPG